MSGVKHDYLGALDAIMPAVGKNGGALFSRATGNRIYQFDGSVLETIEKSLKLADIVTGEPTEGMMDVYRRAFISEERFNGDLVFKAMIAQAEKEIG